MDRSDLAKNYRVTKGKGFRLKDYPPDDTAMLESSDHAYSQIKLLQPNLIILCVRIEDMVVVTERGCEVLTPSQKEALLGVYRGFVTKARK